VHVLGASVEPGIHLPTGFPFELVKAQSVAGRRTSRTKRHICPPTTITAAIGDHATPGHMMHKHPHKQGPQVRASACSQGVPQPPSWNPSQPPHSTLGPIMVLRTSSGSCSDWRSSAQPCFPSPSSTTTRLPSSQVQQGLN
jgi:hypothetical protein